MKAKIIAGDILSKHLMAMVPYSTLWTINAKKTAILEVDGIIEVIEDIGKLYPMGTDIKLWNDVKSELEKL